ncbi:hypothetical protein COBT_001348 [Conglomerata obtusa]
MSKICAHILYGFSVIVLAIFFILAYRNEAEKIKSSQNKINGIDNYKSIFDINATNVNLLDRINIVADPFVHYNKLTTSRMPASSTIQQKNDNQNFNQYGNKRAFEFRCQKTNITKIVQLSNEISDDFLSFANIQKIKGLFKKLRTKSALNKNKLCNNNIIHQKRLYILDGRSDNITVENLTPIINNEYAIKQRVDFYYYLCYKNFNTACRYAIFVDLGNDFMMIFNKTIVYYSNEPIEKREKNNTDDCETRLESIGANRINQVFKKNAYEDIKRYCKENDMEFSYLNHIKNKITKLS